MDKTVPLWIPIVTKSHILSTCLPPWNDWRTTFDSPQMKKSSITGFLTGTSLSSTVYHLTCKKPTTSFHTISSFFFASLAELMTCFARPTQHYLKQWSDHARPLHDHCQWTSFFTCSSSPSLWPFIICFIILHLLTYTATIFPSANVCIRPLS